MWNNTYSHGNMMGWDSIWHWLMSFNGLFALFALVVIIFTCVALFNDWRQDQLEDQRWGKPKHE